jgi:hypothetical protein
MAVRIAIEEFASHPNDRIDYVLVVGIQIIYANACKKTEEYCVSVLMNK